MTVESRGIGSTSTSRARRSTGSEIDYLDTLMGAGFTVNNPNAVSGCGCGSSFRTAGPRAAPAAAATEPSGSLEQRERRSGAALLILGLGRSLVGEALLQPGVRVVVIAIALPEPELVAVRNCRPHLALFQKYFLGTTRRSEVSVLRGQRGAVRDVGEQHVVIVEHLKGHVRGVAVLRVGEHEVGIRVGFARSRMCWMGTPSKPASSRVQRVTQWMSVTSAFRGIARNSSHMKVKGSSTSPQTRKSQVARSVDGTDP